MDRQDDHITFPGIVWNKCSTPWTVLECIEKLSLYLLHLMNLPWGEGVVLILPLWLPVHQPHPIFPICHHLFLGYPGAEEINMEHLGFSAFHPRLLEPHWIASKWPCHCIKSVFSDSGRRIFCPGLNSLAFILWLYWTCYACGALPKASQASWDVALIFSLSSTRYWEGLSAYGSLFLIFPYHIYESLQLPPKQQLERENPVEDCGT